MKNIVLKSLLALFIAFMALPMMGQDWMEINFYDGTYRKFYLKYVTEFAPSKYDDEGRQHDGYEYQRIVTKDDVFIYPISSIKSISFIKYNEVIAKHNYVEAMKGVFNLLGQNSKSTDILNNLDKLKNIEVVESCWSDGHELLVKIKNFGTVPFHFSHGTFIPDQKMEIVDFSKKVHSIIESATGKQLSEGKQITAVLANQTYNDLTFAYNRDEYYTPLKNCFEQSGIALKYIISPKIDFFYNNSSDPNNPHIYDADIVLLDTHGCYNDSTGIHSIFTGDILGVKESDADPSESELNAVLEKLAQLRQKYGLEESDIDFVWHEEFDGNSYRWIAYAKLTEVFFKYRAKGTFKNHNTILFNCACKSLKGKEMHSTYGSFDQVYANYNFANTLLERNLGTYLGYNESNSISPYASSQTFKNMLDGYCLDVACYYLPEQAKAQIRNITIGDDGSSPIAYLMRVPDITDSNYGKIFIIPTYTEEINQNVVNSEFTQNGTIKLKGVTSHYNEIIKGLKYGFKFKALEYGQNPSDISWDKESFIEAILDEDAKSNLGNRVFNGFLSGLEEGKTYYYRAYTYDGMNYNYGNIEQFTIYNPLALSSNSVSLIVGESTTIDITSGSGSYSIEKIEPSGVVTAEIRGNNITVTALKAETATITVKDTKSGKTAIINVTVTENEPTFKTETFTVNGVSFNMVKVEGGTFMMGAPNTDAVATDNEKPQHQVTLDSYSIGQTEVTLGLWKAVMDNTNLSTLNDYYQYPVENVSWYDCQRFIYKLNKLTGRKFSLPTEAEWEFAARGGNKSKEYTYSGSNNVDDVAWYSDNSSYYKHIVGTKSANELGIYDMSGNVWEWCQDFSGPYSSEMQVSPTGPTTGTKYVMRGGSWNFSDFFCRSWHRNQDTPEHTANHLGFRLALSNNGGGNICESICPDDNHPHMIDLGLPSGMKWACCNIDADTPEDYGGYYALFETEVKDSYEWSTYIHADGTDESFHIFLDELLNDIYGFWERNDVAHVKWGGDWSIPSSDESKELNDYCTYKLTNRYGIWGALLTSKTNGNSIFLPAAGYKKGVNRYNVNSYGGYWTDLVEFYDSGVTGYKIYFSTPGGKKLNLLDEEPYIGLPVRAISRSESSNGNFVRPNKSSIKFKDGGSQTIQIVLDGNKPTKSVSK